MAILNFRITKFWVSELVYEEDVITGAVTSTTIAHGGSGWQIGDGIALTAGHDVIAEVQAQETATAGD